ncbi:hypothetical protein ACWD9K_37600 [Streptomyces sp. 900116325]|uniref:hypothetical protein n=1 Tax=Streptomyces sp. NPDC000133 TaxID=3364535 RepID=UPI00368EF064
MSVWAELGWRLIFGAASLAVAFNYRDVAWRVHSFMANTVGVSRFLTPATVRATFGFLAVVLLVELAVGPARS